MCLEDLCKGKFSIYKVGYSMRQYSMSTVSLYVWRKAYMAKAWETGGMSPGLRLSTREVNYSETPC